MHHLHFFFCGNPTRPQPGKNTVGVCYLAKNCDDEGSSTSKIHVHVHCIHVTWFLLPLQNICYTVDETDA